MDATASSALADFPMDAPAVLEPRRCVILLLPPSQRRERHGWVKTHMRTPQDVEGCRRALGEEAGAFWPSRINLQYILALKPTPPRSADNDPMASAAPTAERCSHRELELQNGAATATSDILCGTTCQDLGHVRLHVEPAAFFQLQRSGLVPQAGRLAARAVDLKPLHSGELGYTAHDNFPMERSCASHRCLPRAQVSFAGEGPLALVADVHAALGAGRSVLRGLGAAGFFGRLCFLALCREHALL